MSLELRDEALLRAGLKVWPFDWEPSQWGVHMGIVWATAHSPGHGINGYVLIPAEGHPWSAGFPRDDEDDFFDALDDTLIVHGGVTYAQHPWVGFDTGHAYDIWPPEYDVLGIARGHQPTQWDRHWTPFLVVEETKSLARQVAALIVKEEP